VGVESTQGAYLSPPCSWIAWALGARDWLRERLARPRAPLVVAGLVLLVLLPTVWSGLQIDDLFQRLVVEGKLGSPVGRFDLFDVISRSAAQRARFEELGIYPWWIGPQTQVSYWRPLAALTHVIDYSWWPRAAWLMHLENLAWYGALVLACAALYRRFIPIAWVAGFATAYYAFDQAHAFPAAWVANRNALMSALFGVLSLLAHDRWRSRRRLSCGFVAWACFALALLSAEAGVAIAGYMVAYAVCFERHWGTRGIRGRVLSLVPYVVIAIGWRMVYRALGHGAVGSGANVDPLIHRGVFLARFAQTGPLLLASDVVGVPPEILCARPEWTTGAWLGSVVLLLLLVYAALPWLRSDRSTRFFATGALLSALPFAGTFPSERYLFWVGLGVMGLVAQFVGGLLGTGMGRENSVRFAVCCACTFLRGVASPAVFPLRSTGPGLVQDEFERMVATIPRGPAFREQTVVVLNAPLDVFEACIPLIAMAKGEPAPAHMYMLYAGSAELTVTRTAPDVLEAKVQSGWFSRPEDRLFRDSPLHPGDVVELAAMRAQVESVTHDERPDAIRFEFPSDIGSPSILLLAWGPHGFERVAPPDPEGSLIVGPAPLLVADVMRPHIRERAVEDDRSSTP
jgi:hypothetical protein